MFKKSFLSVLALSLCFCLAFGSMTLTARAALRADEEVEDMEEAEEQGEVSEAEYVEIYSEAFGMYFYAPPDWIFTDAMALDENGEILPESTPEEVDILNCAPATLHHPLADESNSYLPVISLAFLEKGEGMDIEDTDECNEYYTNISTFLMELQIAAGAFENVEILNVKLDNELETAFGYPLGVTMIADSPLLPDAKIITLYIYLDISDVVLMATCVLDINSAEEVEPVLNEILLSLGFDNGEEIEE